MLFYKPLFFNIPLHLTPQEREERERARLEARQHRELLKRMKQEAEHLRRQIPVYLANMEICYRKKKNEKDFFESDVWPVKLDKIQIAEDAYFYHIDTRRLPRGVFLKHLRDESTLETLTAACGSKVEFHETDTGHWYSVETKHGRGAIPVQVGYGEMMKQMSPEADPLSFPLGMGANQKSYFGDMDEMINLLVGGTKGGGKSNLINVMLCTLISRNDPVNLRLFLTDLKGGLEFIDYAGLPHLGGDVAYIALTPPLALRPSGPGVLETGPSPTGEGDLDSPLPGGEGPGVREKEPPKIKTVDSNYTPRQGESLKPPIGQHIATDPHEVLPILRYCEAEMDRRAKLMAGKAKKISAYNKRFKSEPLSYWLVVIDELASLMENKKYALKAALSLSELARKGRAVGIYIVLATQTPSSSIVPQQIANNMDSRAAFRCGSGTASGILLGDGKYEAAKLPNIPGRFLWKWGGEMVELQAPLIADATVKHVVAEAKKGAFTDSKQAERAQKAEFLFSFALANLAGECHTKTLHKFLKPQGFSMHDIEGIVKGYEVRGTAPGLEPEIEIDGVPYYLAAPDQARRIARWLVPVDDFLAGKHPDPRYVFDARRSTLTESTISVDPENSKTSKVQGSDEAIELSSDDVIAEELEDEWFEELWETPDEVQPLEPELAQAVEAAAPAKAKTKKSKQPQPAGVDDLPEWLRD